VKLKFLCRSFTSSATPALDQINRFLPTPFGAGEQRSRPSEPVNSENESSLQNLHPKHTYSQIDRCPPPTSFEAGQQSSWVLANVNSKNGRFLVRNSGSRWRTSESPAHTSGSHHWFRSGPVAESPARSPPLIPESNPSQTSASRRLSRTQSPIPRERAWQGAPAVWAEGSQRGECRGSASLWRLQRQRLARRLRVGSHLK
jgi:hypothetical protein